MHFRKHTVILICLVFSLLTSVRSLGNTVDSVPVSAHYLSQYVQIQSVTGTEKEAGIYLSRLASEMGLHVQVFTEEIDSYNFAASLYPLTSGKPNVVFLTHIDVVDAQEEHLNQYPPFSGIIAENCVWGRGTLDNKGMGIMQLMAISKYVELAKTSDLPYNITLLAVSSEEIGGVKGAKIISEHFLDQINPVVVYGEGGSGFDGLFSKEPQKHVYGISVAAKRYLWIELSLNVKVSGHGSIPPPNYSTQELINALARVLNINKYRPLQYSDPAIRMFKDVGEIERGYRGRAFRNIKSFSPLVSSKLRKNILTYSVLSNTITITSLFTTPGAPNVIPSQTKAILDCRLLPGVTTDEFVDKMRKWLMNDSIKIKIIGESILAPSTVPENFFYKMKIALQKEYQDSEVISLIFPASNDNNYFRAKGIPTYGILPIFMTPEMMGSLHNVNEKIPIESLESGIRVYDHLIHEILFEPVIKVEE
jgi:carboxypeptidase PM20D1